MVEMITGWIERQLRISPELQTRLLATLLAVLLLLLLRWLVIAIVRRRPDDTAVHYRWRKIAD